MDEEVGRGPARKRLSILASRTQDKCELSDRLHYNIGCVSFSRLPAVKRV